MVGGSVGGPNPASLFLHRDGGSFGEIAAGTDATLWWIWGTSDHDIWLVGERGTVLRYDGVRTRALAVPPEAAQATLFGVWGSSSDDVWIVGGVPDVSGVVLHAAGDQVTLAGDIPAAQSKVALFKVWGASADDVFVVGQYDVLLHRSGGRWTAQAPPAPASAPLFTVAGAAGSVYVVGGTGASVLLRYDGASWNRLGGLPLDGIGGLTGVSVGADGTLALVGFGGTRLHGRWNALVDDSDELTNEDLHGTLVTGDGTIWAVGGNYQAPPAYARHGVVLRYGR